MKTNFIKSMVTAVAVISLASACSHNVSKDAANKCAGKNSCDAKKTTKNDCKAKDSKNDCKAKGSKNSCKAKETKNDCKTAK